MVPPSTRNAAPVVADASGLTRYATSVATSLVVAKRLMSEVGRTFSKNSVYDTNRIGKVNTVLTSENRIC